MLILKVQNLEDSSKKDLIGHQSRKFYKSYIRNLAKQLVMRKGHLEKSKFNPKGPEISYLHMVSDGYSPFQDL